MLNDLLVKTSPGMRVCVDLILSIFHQFLLSYLPSYMTFPSCYGFSLIHPALINYRHIMDFTSPQVFKGAVDRLSVNSEIIYNLHA